MRFILEYFLLRSHERGYLKTFSIFNEHSKAKGLKLEIIIINPRYIVDEFILYFSYLGWKRGVMSFVFKNKSLLPLKLSERN